MSGQGKYLKTSWLKFSKIGEKYKFRNPKTSANPKKNKCK